MITKEVININLSLESSQFFGVFPIEAKGSVPINYWEIAFCGKSCIKNSVHSISKTLCSLVANCFQRCLIILSIRSDAPVIMNAMSATGFCSVCVMRIH